jgi:hypothetical protein
MVDYTALPGSLDLFELMVNYVAGGVALSLLIWAVILMITGILGRMSMPSIIVILATFGAAASVGYIGSLAAVPILLFTLWYMVKGIINYINSMR